ncbi:TetR/AcrR family transcriptional regulator [Ureibacillus acetophenoni]|uniref:TetR family transcriptional regulator n=1 Tax=Ureibacillus acetophenoni TaxID=614649 RepID=A0A285TYH3_9BACL|nr:TetR/AcrR family transcriptional regulator [Ureibacillus acetophenoni]SOC34705.1 TetR family transcriptional regulator [Ureibacillus acetophenoni]
MAEKEKIVVQTSVKDESLIEIRRLQIVNGAVNLFKEKGFHRATTREIAKAAGFSIGTLYEYIRTKEDVLYLVSDHIYDKVKQQLAEINSDTGTVDELKEAIKQYFCLIDRMSDEFTIMYQETKSLSKEAMHYVFDKEFEMVRLFEGIIKNSLPSLRIELTEKEVFLTANHIVVQGQAWAFRKWAFKKRYTIEEYVEDQTKLILSGLLHFQDK